MIPERFIALMNQEIDGTNSTKGSAELRNYLESSTEASSHYDALCRTMGWVDADRDVEPPSHVVERVLGKIPWGSSRFSPWGEQRLFAWLRTVSARPQFRFGGAFALGTAAGVILFALAGNPSNRNVFHQPLDNTDISGTMKTVHLSKEFSPMGATRLSVENIRAGVEFYGAPGVLVAEVSMDGPDPIEWSLSYGSENVALEGFRRGGENQASVMAGLEETRVVQDGSGRCLLYFSRGEAEEVSMTLRIFEGGRQIHETPLVAHE